MQRALRQTFASLAVPNFRLYFIGQGISLIGTWMQMVGLGWLVLQLTHSGTQLGLVTAAQTLPILLFGIVGGVAADRFDKRHTLFVTQAIQGLLALILGLLVVSHTVHIWMIYPIAVCFGLINTVDNPTRQSFVVEMVGRDRLRNAVTLNSTVVNAARVIGPSIAAALIATVGIGLCFVINGLSFIAVLTALKLMNTQELSAAPRAANEPGQIRAGLAYAWRTPAVRSTLIMMFIIGTFAYEFPVVLPLFSTRTLHDGASAYSALTAAMGIGAVVGGLYSAGRSETSQKLLAITAAVFGLSILLASIVPSLGAAFIIFILVGGLSVLFISLGNTTLQLTSEPSMRGRVMSMWSIAFQGTTPIGGPIIGTIADHTSPRLGLAVGGISAVFAAGIGLLVLRPIPKRFNTASAQSSEEQVI